jgi:tetratricopeptide (TPR) repeat protein
MKYLLIIISFALISNTGQASTDSLEIVNLKSKIKMLELNVDEVRQGQVNYKIEKDVLKETYQSNYKNINVIITLILGVITVLGYLGIRDINSIKKEYVNELNQLKELKTKFDLKADEFDKGKEKFDTDIKGILEENEEQNRKIKFIELKEKVKVLLNENSLTSALEFANAALELKKDDIAVLNLKGSVLSRLNQLSDALKIFESALSIDPTAHLTIVNITECYLFANDHKKADELMELHKDLFNTKYDGQLQKLFEIIKCYNLGDLEEFDSHIKDLVEIGNPENKMHRIKGWSLKEALFFATHLKDSDLKIRLSNTLWYLDGQLSAMEVYTRLRFEIPKKDDPKIPKV